MRDKTRACTGRNLNRALALVVVLTALVACKDEQCRSKSIFKDIRPVEVFTATEVDISVTLEFDSDPSVLPALFDSASVLQAPEKATVSARQSDFEVLHSLSFTFHPNAPSMMSLHLTRFSRISKQEMIDTPLSFQIDFSNGNRLELGFQLASQGGLAIRDFSWKEQVEGCSHEMGPP